jgi:hypothetical protein
VAITIPTNGYCLIEDVANILSQRTFTPDSKPSLADVEGFITDGFIKINDALRAQGYAVPLTNAGDVATVKVVNKKLAAIQVEITIALGLGRELSEGVALLKEDCEAWFKGLADGEIQLTSGASSTYEPAGQPALAPGGEDETPDFKISDPVI